MNSPTKVAPGNTPPRCTYRKFDQKEKLRCRFCRGESCVRCGKEAHKQCTKPAISNFHCNWITDSIMAMQRPSDELFDSIMLIEAFQCNGITAVINLCEPGEHPYCGYPLKSSGFPYTPERLMAAGIKYFNFYWQDMTAPSLSIAQNTIRVALSEILSGGKVAVHCHAGYGRTGIVVACLAMILQHLPAEQAVALVRAQRPGSVQTSTQQLFISQFYDVYHLQSCIYPPSQGEAEAITLKPQKPLAESMDDELLSPPLQLMTGDRYTLLAKEELPNAVRLSGLILHYLSPQLGKIGLSLALARMSLAGVNVDRSIALSVILSSSQDREKAGSADGQSPVKTFLLDNRVAPSSTGAFVCEAPSDIIAHFKSLANDGKWKQWFCLPATAAVSVPSPGLEEVPSTRPEFIPGQLSDEDYDQQHVNIAQLLAPFVASSPQADTTVSAPTLTDQTESSLPLSIDMTVTSTAASPELVTFMACHGHLLLDWFDSRADALFTPALLQALKFLRLGDYGPYYFSRRGEVPAVTSQPESRQGSYKDSLKSSGKGHTPHTSGRNNALDDADEESLWSKEEEHAIALDNVFRQHLSKRNLLLLEAVIDVLSPLLEEERSQQGGAQQQQQQQQTGSEVSVCLVCAEVRVALSMCQHFSTLSKLLVSANNGIDREAVENLFQKNILTFDTNPLSRGGGPSIVGDGTIHESEAFPATGDFESVDDLVNSINALRFLCVHKWSALGDSFLACSAGSPTQMQKSMLSTRLNNVHWNEEWLD